MSSVLALKSDIMTSQLPAALNSDPWLTATEAQRQTAELRYQLIGPGLQLIQAGASVNNVASLLAERLRDTDSAVQQQLLARLGDVPSVRTLKRWLSAFQREGKAGLLSRHTGRVRQDYGWELRAMALYNLPSKPTYAAVALKLRKEGFDSATESRVKTYLKSLPATVGPNSPARVGRHLHKLRHQKYQPRTLEQIKVGDIYAGDGHTCDCYVAHPNTGGVFRPELTAFIDIRSRYVPGWYLSEAESALSTVFALSHAMQTHDHLPLFLYLDRGAGYRSKLLNDEATGFYSRFEMDVIGALPGNPHGKGWIERWFRTVRDHHDKFFAGGQVYCGNDMAEEVNRRLSSDVKAGKRKLPSLADYAASLSQFIHEYNHTPMDVLDGRTPAQVWASLERNPVVLSAEAIVRPREKRTVRRQMVELHKRQYYANELALYDGKQLTVEYDLHNDAAVWLYDAKDRFVCQAGLVRTVGVVPQSRLEEQRDKRLQGQIKRLQKKADEARARRQDAITISDQLEQLPDLSTPLTARVPVKTGIVIDLLNNDE
ncbi:transposase [Cupriavidus gilardii]|uniref:Mu transposase C-terminal domain-containing protein n=1 Tax=Cupriavidus gilardii TaxID=82541 RepID=UPI001EE525E5|nr:Mu transposase C-terminal domain-containing protein [Cupriavidus gilardii]MCG5260400.1 Mu transposase C-terminal domain-containing protein [Cupriavidus gilardii]MDF9428250.1 transposase [Cupriavidus gilardii]